MPRTRKSQSPQPSGYYDQPWEARVQAQTREEVARLITLRLDDVLQAATAGEQALTRALTQLIAEVRSGVIKGSHRSRLPLMPVHGDQEEVTP